MMDNKSKLSELNEIEDQIAIIIAKIEVLENPSEKLIKQMESPDKITASYIENLEKVYENILGNDAKVKSLYKEKATELRKKSAGSFREGMVAGLKWNLEYLNKEKEMILLELKNQD